MLTPTLALLLPWLCALLLTPLVMRFARARGFVDHPTERKQHLAPVPLLGGVAVFASIGAGLLLAALVSAPLQQGLLGTKSLGALFLGAVAIVGLGVYDDLADMSPWTKLAGEVAIAAGTWLLGFRAGSVELPFGWFLIDAPALSFVVTVVWIVVVTNAFNLIDGMDGLAAGTGIAASLTMFVLAVENRAGVSVLFALALAGALAGFLRYNLPPARIFLGDAGALGIGYATAVMSIASYQKSPTAVVLTVPILILGLPLLDTVLAVLRRTADHVREQGARGLRPLEVTRAVVRGDRGHIHHLLLRSGWSVRAVLFTLYAISGALGAVALATRESSANLRWTLWLALIAAGFLALARIRHHAERRERRAAESTQAAPRAADASRRATG